jgi:hypothetical protein
VKLIISSGEFVENTNSRKNKKNYWELLHDELDIPAEGV